MDRTAELNRFKTAKELLVAPSLLSADVLNMEAHIEKLEGEYDWFHLDIMDGHFVPNLSYGPTLLKALCKHYPEVFIDTHIMVEPAESFTEMFIREKPSLLTVHAEATPNIHRVLQSIKAAGISAGIAINPGTPVEIVKPVLQMADLVLVMSVNPGYGGQKFIPEVLGKVRTLVEWRKEMALDFLIEMDGGINEENAALIYENGCDVAVAGSAVFGKENPAQIIRNMKAKAGK